MKYMNSSRAEKYHKLFTAAGLVAIFVAVGLGLPLSKDNIHRQVALASAQEAADINNDNAVDVFDLSILLARWNTADAAADLNKNGAVDVFDLSMLLAKWGPVDTVVTPGTLPTVMKMLSLNKPAYASAGTASNAVDSSYETAWSPGASGWLAIDLSAEPPANRQSVVLAWYTNPDDGHSVDSYNMSCPAWTGRPYLSSYTIQINSAAGGGSAPGSGWQTVATVTGNNDLSGQHLVALGGSNWIRISGSGPNGIDINVDVADASQGVGDGWLFMGDSVTAGYGGHFTDLDDTGVERRSFTEMISAGTSGLYRPIQENAAMSCSHASGTIGVIDAILDKFPGKYVTLNLGTNDGWGGTGDPEAYYSNMTTLVSKVRAKGKIAVIPTILWPNNLGTWQAGIEAMNAKILQIYQENPDVVRGPDLYAITKDKPNLYNGPGDVHLNGTGGAVARKAWADAMLTRVYGK